MENHVERTMGKMRPLDAVWEQVFMDTAARARKYARGKDLTLCMGQELSMPQLRDIATMVDAARYSCYGDLPVRLTGGREGQACLASWLNGEFRRRLGDLRPYYEAMDKAHNREKFEGDVSYCVLSRLRALGMTELEVLLNALWFKSLAGRALDVLLALELQKVFTHLLAFPESKEGPLGAYREEERFVEACFGNPCKAWAMVRPEKDAYLERVLPKEA